MEESEPDWAAILQVMYEESMTPKMLKVETEPGIIPFEDLEDVEKNEFLNAHKEWEEDQVERLSIATGRDDTEVRRVLDNMERLDLIERVNVAIDPAPVALSKKGFDVAHERELRNRQQYLLKSQNDATRGLVVFTVVLGVAAVIQALAAVVNTPPPTNVMLLFGYLILIIFVLVYGRRLVLQDRL